MFIIAIISYKKNSESPLNRTFALFFLTGAIYFLIETISFYGANQFNSLEYMNLFRDFKLILMIAGMFLALSAVLIIEYGWDGIFRNLLFIGSTLLAVLFSVLAIIGDSIEMGMDMDMGDHAHHTEVITRTDFGWIGITGSFLIFGTLLLFFLAKFLIQFSDWPLRLRLVRLFGGFFLIIAVLFMFDVSFDPAFSFIQNNLIENDFYHTTLHVVIVLGAVSMLSAFWTPLSGSKS